MIRKASVTTLVFTFVFCLAIVTPTTSEAQSGAATIVDINSAPLQEIEAIVVDSDIAQRIVDNRPYTNKRQLLSRRLLSEEQYDQIKDRIIARRIQTPDVSR